MSKKFTNNKLINENSSLYHKGMKDLRLTSQDKQCSGKKWPTAVDLFCGCGGVTEGLKRRNFKIVAAVDNDKDACATYQANHPKVRLYSVDIRQVDAQNIRSHDLNDQDLDLLVVCAPCQPFSSQNRSNKIDDRSDLIYEATRFAKVLKPAVIFFENVPGLATKKYKKILDKLTFDLEKLGYQVSQPIPIDAADYNVPQRRKRCVLLAVLNAEVPDLPKPVTPDGKRITVKHAIGDLCSLKSGEKDPNDLLHHASEHLPIALERLKYIPKNGGSRFSLPENLVLECHKTHSGHGDVYGRMKWEDVAPTLTTGCTDLTRGRFAHPEDDRAITLREAAILQSFPRHYKFKGNRVKITTQIGNAVPVELIKAIVPTLRQAIKNVRYSKNNIS
jgi:DNA (cytosine-5)-methyltransferase 1